LAPNSKFPAYETAVVGGHAGDVAEPVDRAAVDVEVDGADLEVFEED